MLIKPVVQPKSPEYPDRDASHRNPKLLQSTPERWKRNTAAATALAAASAMLLSSCSILTGKTGNAAVPVPFFDRGGGYGGFGCVSVAPPAFLSESEAYTVIQEEAGKTGISFEQYIKELDGIRLPETATGPEGDHVVGSKSGTLELDGYDEKRKIAFEFVSAEDIEAWCAKPSNATVTSYAFKDTAEALNQNLSKAKTGIPVAVFYDPGYRYDEVKQIIEDNRDDYSKMQDALREYVKEDLRAQVRDFIAWLQSQDII